MSEEIWKQVNSWEGYYWVSNLGRVKNKHNKILSLQLRANGYHQITLCKGQYISKTYTVHRLVAEAFVPNPDSFPIINHKDEDKLNNEADNLEWCTAEYNSHYSMHKDLRVYCFDLDKEFTSASVAAVHTGVCRSSIVKACRGQLHQAGGKLWCYSKDKPEKFPRK